jgi:Tat protein secretion system quality control protein TatD with DNase activity
MGRKCVAWGEMGLDYHYNHSPHNVQQAVLIRQIKHAVSLNKHLVSTSPQLLPLQHNLTYF